MTNITFVAAQNSGGGFLTYLFEAGDEFNLDLGISYAFSGKF
jgi:hypothetical protein